MTLTFLGTGTSQGIPVIGSNHPVCMSNDFKDKRLRVSVWIKTQKNSIVIDTTPDFRYQMLRSGCVKIDALFFTHQHADHTAGIDDIRPFCFSHGALPIYLSKQTAKNLRHRFDYIFETENRYPGAPEVKLNLIDKDQSFFVNDEEIIPVEVMHGDLPVLGFRIQNLAYITDMKTITAKEEFKLRDLDILVINALRIESHHSHLNLEEALQFINKIKPKKSYLTHISHHLGFHEQVSKTLPENIFLAYDQLTINI